MTPLQLFFLVAIGLIAGVGSGLFGIGGGVVIVPLLMFGFALEQKTASATSLVAMILPVGLLGVREYFKAGIITSSHIRMGLLISMGIFLGTLVGSKISVILPTKYLTKGFALLLIYVSLRLWLQSNK